MFLTLFIGVAEVATALYVSSLLEAGVRQASRMGVVGSAPEGGDLMQGIMDTIEEAGNGLIDMDDAEVETMVYESFDAVGTGEEELSENPCTETLVDGVCFADSNGNGVFDEDFGQPGLGGPNDIVLYRVTYDWPSMTGYFGELFGGEDEAITLSAAIAVRNEPF